MGRLTWDKVGQRVYEAGIDRGVLYQEDTFGVVWNGLVSIEENFSDDTSEPIYLDGVKILDAPSIGDFSATLTAFTYPDEFLEYEGVKSLGGGLFVDGQNTKMFGLSYRTMVGNDIDGIEHGYKLHLLYHLTAVPDSTSYDTLSDSPNPIAFSWTITGVPDPAPNYRATAHVIFDSRYINPDVLSGIEDILYGRGVVDEPDVVYDGGDPDDPEATIYDGGDPDPSDDPPTEILDSEVVTAGASDARLPSIEELMDIVFFWDPRFIIPNTVTGLAQLVPGIGDLVQIAVEGIYVTVPSTRLIPTITEGIYILES